MRGYLFSYGALGIFQMFPLIFYNRGILLQKNTQSFFGQNLNIEITPKKKPKTKPLLMRWILEVQKYNLILR